MLREKVCFARFNHAQQVTVDMSVGNETHKLSHTHNALNCTIIVIFAKILTNLKLFCIITNTSHLGKGQLLPLRGFHYDF